jgi:hypothetical protein
MLRKPGQYGNHWHLKEHKLCDQCGESEIRLNALFCCWCGARFTTVIIDSLSYKTILVETPIGGTTGQPRRLPLPSNEEV